MAHPRSSYMPGDTLLKHLAKVQALDDMFLVTEVCLCPAYSLYLSSGGNFPRTLETEFQYSLFLLTDMVFR